MFSKESVTITKHIKLPQLKLVSKYDPEIPVKSTESRTWEELLEDSDLLLKTNLSLISLVSFNDNCNNDASMQTDGALNELKHSESPHVRKQKKKSKLVNVPPKKRPTTVFRLNEHFLRRMRNIKEPHIEIQPKVQQGNMSAQFLSPQGYERKETLDELTKEIIAAPSFASESSSEKIHKKKRSAQIYENLASTDHYCMDWITKNFNRK
ncbi:hypothetical protein HHI36_006126 [Cryptolaemus montrouzieri]|uniref:Uncharacterized protein n=1 Tax=Cryptolaemus montrouzieri TaxID=559131 RepID=A0ABD2NWP4_9CUCU